MAATIKDIAKRLNISVSTVSYALNDGPRPVPPEVKQKVLDVARELRYRPNRVARQMVTGRSYTIGVVPYEPAHNLVLSPFFQISANAIVNAAEEAHHDVLLFTRCDQHEAERMLSALLDGRVDGLVFVSPPTDAPVLDELARTNMPHVVVAGGKSLAPRFYADNYEGAKLALEHLYELGHRKIAHVKGIETLEDSQARYLAYLDFLSERGLPLRPEWVYQGRFTIESGQEALEAMAILPERPTAVFCANDEMAAGVIRAAASRGITVPQDLSVAGFDDAQVSRIFSPMVTTVRQPVEEIAGAATRALLAMIDGKEAPTTQVFSTELVIRESTTHPTEDQQ